MPMRSPQFSGQLASADFQSLRCKVLTDARYIALEDIPCSGIGFRWYHLREIDQRDVSIPIQDVICRQVAVDSLFREEQVNIPNDAIKQGSHFLRLERYGVERGRGAR